MVLPKIYKRWLLLQGRANLVLGLTYFQIGEYRRALRFLDRVPPENENYPRALLALGWCYLKLQQYQKMVRPLETFVKNFPDSEYYPEVLLLLGQAHLKIRLYDRSISYFSKMLTLFPPRSENDLLLKSIEKKISPVEEQIERQRTELLIQESRLLDSFQLPSKKWIPKYMVKEIKKLEIRREKLLQTIEAEKESLAGLTQSLNSLKLLIQLRTRDWRSYAEYGISRALFLKEQEG